MALKTGNKKQQEHVLAILRKNHVCAIDQDENGLYLDDFITYEDMAAIVDYLRTSTDKKKDLFEECWVAYRRKGVKKKAKDYWNKLSDEETDMVMPHIKAYVASRDIQYQKDFERYLRDRVFMEVVYSGNNLVYDPTKDLRGESKYSPTCGGALMYNDFYKCYLYIGWYTDGDDIQDGYTSDNRPDGAEIMLNNGRGTLVWSRESKKWRKK